MPTYQLTHTREGRLRNALYVSRPPQIQAIGIEVVERKERREACQKDEITVNGN